MASSCTTNKQEQPNQTIRAPGNGRKARRKRRLEAQQRGDNGLFSAPFLHGNTVPGRLRLVDQAWKNWVSDWKEDGSKILAMDVGIGDSPETTLEWKTILEELLPDDASCHLIGTEIDPQRLQNAKDRLLGLAQSTTSSTGSQKVTVSFEWSGTNFQLPGEVPPSFIRAMNVLRDYHIRDACVALHRLYNQLNDSATGRGVLVEGSTNSTGSIAVAFVLENKRARDHGEITVQAVFFGIDFDRIGFRNNSSENGIPNDATASTIDDQTTLFCSDSTPPQWFQATLPRLWRHCFDESVHIDTLPSWTRPMNQFLTAWHHASLKCQSTCKDRWLESVDRLSQDYCLCKAGIHQGILIWENPIGLYVPDPSEALA